MALRFKTIREFFDDPKAHAAWTATIGGGIIVFTTPGTWKEKAPYVADYIWGLFGIWAAVIIAKGYEKGKALEGTIPDGRIPTPTTAPTTNVNLVAPTGDVQISNATTTKEPPATASVADQTALDAATAAALAALAAGHSRRKDIP